MLITLLTTSCVSFTSWLYVEAYSNLLYQVLFNRVLLTSTNRIFEVDKPGIQADRLLCFLNLLGSSQFWNPNWPRLI